MDNTRRIIQSKKARISLFFLVVSILIVSSGLIIMIQGFKKSNSENNAAEAELFLPNNVGGSFSFESLDENEGDDDRNTFFGSSGGGGSGGGSRKGKEKDEGCDEETIETNQELLETIVPDKSPEERLEEINKKIKEKGAKWKAGLTPKALLSVEEKRKLLGNFMLPDKDNPNIKEVLIATNVSSLPSYFDWRNKDGENWMTSVKDQGSSCGSCWAFSAVGIVEAAYNIYNDNSSIDLDLSEQQLVSDDGMCCDDCGNCERGGFMGNALYYIKHVGITNETCFPYTATTATCSLCPDWQQRKYYITNYFKVTPNTTKTYKQALMDYGPLSIGINHSDMFYYYTSGIYEELGFAGADHGVVLVGWNNTGEYWIIKNSWGTGWGENGYAKMAYGDIEKYNYVYAVNLSIECSYNSDCGTDGYGGELFCQEDNVWQNYITHTCNNAGEFVAYCSNSTAPKLNESCGEDYCDDWQNNYCEGGYVHHNKTCYYEGCSGGACFSNPYWEEEKVEECGENYCETWQGNYCKGNDVYHERICHNRGCSDEVCFDNIYREEQLVEVCPNECTGGRCKVLECIEVCTWGGCYEYCEWK